MELDSLTLKDGSDGLIVKTCFKKILKFRLRFFNEGVFHYKWSSIWRKDLPSKVSFLVWLIVRDKVLSQENLKKKGIAMAERCALCRNSSENRSHLFQDCPYSFKIWNYFCAGGI